MYNRFSRVSLSLSALAAAAVLLASPLPSYALTQEAIPTQPQSQDQAPAPIQNSQPAAALFPAQPIASLSPYQLLPNSIPDLEERYLAWGEANPQLSAEQVVLAVNIGLDKAYYEDTGVVAQPDSLTVLVNKYHALPQDYIPQLETLGSPYGSGSLRPEAAAAFRAMADAARADGISLRSVSAYRSYQRQESVYNRYLRQDTQASVDSYSARPGFSEHQTALALDINVASLSAHFENTPAYAWLVEHCADYGFILRYPQGKEDITGYRFEPWHYRYVGTEIAKACMEQDLTFEEYLAQQPTKQDLPQTGPVEGLPWV